MFKLNPDQFMKQALGTEGGLAIPFLTQTAAKSFRNACLQHKSRSKQQMTAAFAEDPNFEPFSLFDGLFFSIDQRRGQFWLIAERALDVQGEAVPAAELKKIMDNPSAEVDKQSPAMDNPSVVDKA